MEDGTEKNIRHLEQTKVYFIIFLLVLFVLFIQYLFCLYKKIKLETSKLHSVNPYIAVLFLIHRFFLCTIGFFEYFE